VKNNKETVTGHCPHCGQHVTIEISGKEKSYNFICPGCGFSSTKKGDKKDKPKDDDKTSSR
jgi:predicted RNA-binding Zn-ribbon protein involved in translation (DUF1610 family)